MNPRSSFVTPCPPDDSGKELEAGGTRWSTISMARRPSHRHPEARHPEGRSARTRSLLILLLMTLPAALGLASEPSSRPIYRRIDEKGVVCFTDNPDRYDRWETFINAPSRSGSRFMVYKANFHRWDATIRKLGEIHNIDPALIKAVVMAESAFNPRAKSPAGARGLMQLLPETARLVGVHDIWDPEQNLEGGTRFLKQMLMRFGSRRLAVAAYNSGPKAVAKYGGVPPYRETRTYVQRVEAFYQEFLLNDLSFSDRY